MEALAVLLLLLPTCLPAAPSPLVGPDEAVELHASGGYDQEAFNAEFAGKSNCAIGQKATPQQALNELFTCLLVKNVAGTDAYRRSKGVNFHGIAGNGVTRAPLLRGVYSVAELLKSPEAESYRRYFDVKSVFNVELGSNEVRGPAELAKLEAYLKFLESSPFIKDTYATLVSNGAVNSTGSVSQFVRGTMYDYWFKQYARTAKAQQRGLRESSGFGHVFVGEVKANEVTGFHSWLQLLASEEAGTFEYKGYVRVVNGTLLIGGIQFNWLGRQKPLSSVMIGVPPEFEIALYTACFAVYPGRKCSVSVSGKTINMQTFRVDHQRESVATAYPLV